MEGQIPPEPVHGDLQPYSYYQTSKSDKQNQNTWTSLNRVRTRIFPLKSNQPGDRESEGQANGELSKVRDMFQHLSALVHWSTISLGEIKRQYRELT